MTTENTLDLIDRQEWLEPLADGLQKGVHQAFEQAGEAGQKVKNALHGVWLGHPAHPAITDVPLGAWTAAVVCDAMEEITGRREFGHGADVAVTVGLAGAVISAVTGLTDWSDTAGRARKIGLTHGLLNITGTLLYASSLICRKKGNRGGGRGLGMLGYAIALGAAWLGGELVYGEQVGVNHAAGIAPPLDFVPVAGESDLREGEPKRVDAKGVPVLLVRRGGKICALAATCSHAGGPLDEGKIEGDTVTCPWHGSQFDLNSGKVINGPATSPQPCFETRVRDGQIEVSGMRHGK